MLGLQEVRQPVEAKASQITKPRYVLKNLQASTIFIISLLFTCFKKNIFLLQTPDSPVSDQEMEIPNSEQLSKDLSEKLQEIEEVEPKESDQVDHVQTVTDGAVKVKALRKNISPVCDKLTC